MTKKTDNKLQTINDSIANVVDDIELKIQSSNDNMAAKLGTVTSTISGLEHQLQLSDEKTANQLQTVNQTLTDSLIGIKRDVQLNSVNILNTVSTKLQTINETFATNVNSIRQDIVASVLAKLNDPSDGLSILKGSTAKCDIQGYWRRIAYFDTTQGDLCPLGLRTVVNTTTNQTACGRTVNGSCTSLTFATGLAYSNVCGRVRGYQFGHMDGFEVPSQRPLN